LKFQGAGERVILQSLPSGSPLSNDENESVKVVLTLGALSTEPIAKGIMPDLRGKTKRQALALLAPLGLKVNFKGEGIVRSQFPSVGRALQDGTSCELNCEIPVANVSDSGPGGNS
jgi:beta-lactam-binding protein with PASTA domain